MTASIEEVTGALRQSVKETRRLRLRKSARARKNDECD